MEPTGKLLSEYFRERHGADGRGIRVTPLGRGSHGRGYRVEFTSGGERRTAIVKRLDGGTGLGHDYPSDRAGVFLLAGENYGRLPRHVKALDVVAEGRDGRVFSIHGGREYYLVMEEAAGENYFRDLRLMGDKAGLDGLDRARIRAMAAYLARIHSKKRTEPRLYYRKLRDTVGHGECLMGVFDTYETPGFTDLAEMADIEKACVGWRARLKPLHARLSVTHGDFHPGNIHFTGGTRFRLLDRSRGEYGEPADDVTALAINYVFFSIAGRGRTDGAYAEALALFWDEYVSATGDDGLCEVAAPFFAFRGAVVANPLFYPDVTDEARGRILGFVHGVLRSERFDPAGVNRYMEAGLKYRKRFV